MNTHFSDAQKKLARDLIEKYSKKYGASVNEMNAIAMMESSFRPSLGVHPDGLSFGLMGITVPAQTEYNTRTGSFADRKQLNDNIAIACWYWGKRIPQMLKYFEKKNTLRNRTISYNAGISYVVNQKEIPARTLAYIQHMEDSKKKISFPLMIMTLLFGWMLRK